MDAVGQRGATRTDAPVAPASPLRNTAERRTERILLVEDNATNHGLAMLQLEKLGFAADSAFNGREALAAMARRPYDLVFMDCQKPEMDGFAATQAVRRRTPGPKIAPRASRRA